MGQDSIISRCQKHTVNAGSESMRTSSCAVCDMGGLALREEDFVRAFLDGGTLDMILCLFHLLKQYLGQYNL
jgi:hypothetical protein